MDKISLSSLDWANTHIKRYGDTDTLPVPFEFEAIRHGWSKLRPYLGNLDLQARFHFHCTPTSASWLNMVERFFRDLTINRLCRGVFRDVMELVHAIDTYVDHHNEHPKPFIWTASANDILEKVKRARKTRVNVQFV